MSISAPFFRALGRFALPSVLRSGGADAFMKSIIRSITHDPEQTRDEVEVPVSAQHRKRVLAAESRNPNVIGRNRGSGSFEFTVNGGIGGRCLLIHVQHPELLKVFDKPVFVALPLARL